MSDGTASDRRVRPLNATEVEAYTMVGEDLAAKVRIIRLPALPGPYQGLTMGRFIFLTRRVDDQGRSPLLAHELVHVRQWSEIGVVGFTVRYLSQFMTGLFRSRSWSRAYQGIEAEQEARTVACEWRRALEP